MFQIKFTVPLLMKFKIKSVSYRIYVLIITCFKYKNGNMFLYSMLHLRSKNRLQGFPDKNYDYSKIMLQSQFANIYITRKLYFTKEKMKFIA